MVILTYFFLLYDFPEWKKESNKTEPGRFTSHLIKDLYWLYRWLVKGEENIVKKQKPLKNGERRRGEDGGRAPQRTL